MRMPPGDSQSRAAERFLMTTLPADPSGDLGAVAQPSRRLTLEDMRASVRAVADLDGASTSPNQTPTRHGTYSYPGDSQVAGEAPGADLLLAVLVKATAARGKRKALRAPRLPTQTAYVRVRGRVSRGTFERVNLHLRRLARRALNDLHKAGEQLPDRATLAAGLALYVFEELPRLLRNQAPGETPPSGYDRWAWLDDDAVRRVAASAARYQLERWTPDYIEEQQRRASVGGSRSRPPLGIWDDPANLDALAALDGMTTAQQAEALGVSPATIDRGRKRLRERQQPAPAPVERSPHARLTERQERAASVRERAEEDEAYARAAETEARTASEREHAEHMARLAILARRPPDPARDLDALLPA